eukprot:scaffold1279_cov306-Prasinococcus_capsulatus_cf.AAC.5
MRVLPAASGARAKSTPGAAEPGMRERTVPPPPPACVSGAPSSVCRSICSDSKGASTTLNIVKRPSSSTAEKA